MGYLDKEKTDALNKIKRERKIGNLDSPKNPFDYYDREYGTVPRDTKSGCLKSLTRMSTASLPGAMTPPS
jgi:hypothetical protein